MSLLAKKVTTIILEAAVQVLIAVVVGYVTKTLGQPSKTSKQI